jgi:hypothetical protein
MLDKFGSAITKIIKEKPTMRRILFICSALVLFAATAAAQKTKPWTEWSDKDALKMLTDSAWAQTQTELSDTSQSSSGSAITRAAENKRDLDTSKSGESGESLGRSSSALSVKYFVSFLTAKPIRQAFIRMIEIQRPEMPSEKVAELRTFVDRDFGEYVVVTVKLDGSDQKRLGPARQEIATADAELLKTTSYLERKDGKRVSLMEFRAPAQDGMGAKFVFPRLLDGKPFLDANSGDVRVFIQVGKTKLNRRFKVTDMMYEGKLEY